MSTSGLSEDASAAILALLSRQEGHVETLVSLVSTLVKESEQRHAELRQRLGWTMLRVQECLLGQYVPPDLFAQGSIDLDDVLAHNASLGKAPALQVFEGLGLDSLQMDFSEEVVPLVTDIDHYFADGESHKNAMAEVDVPQIIKAEIKQNELHEHFSSSRNSLSTEIAALHERLGSILSAGQAEGQRQQTGVSKESRPDSRQVSPGMIVGPDSEHSLTHRGFTFGKFQDNEFGIGDDQVAPDPSNPSVNESVGVDIGIDGRRMYTTESKYKSHGCPQAVARSPTFANLTFLMIIFNSVFMAFDTSFNNETSLYQSDWIFIVCANVFCVFFLVELCVRLFAFQRKRDSLRDGWFCFDAFMMLFMVMETWLIDPLTLLFHGSLATKNTVLPWRVLRLMRIARVSMVVRNMPELVSMTKGLLQGARACCASVIMILILVYCFGMIMFALLHNEHVIHGNVKGLIGVSFDTLGHCMWILTVNGTFMLDGTGDMATMLLFADGYKAKCACLVFVSFLFLSALMISNLLIGVLCEVVGKVSESERNKKDTALMKKTMVKHLMQYDDGNGLISASEFCNIMHSPESKETLDCLNVDRNFMIALVEVIFRGGSSHIPIKMIMKIMLMCRADNPATVQTMANCVAYLGTKLNSIEMGLTALQDNYQLQNLAKSL